MVSVPVAGGEATTSSGNIFMTQCDGRLSPANFAESDMRETVPEGASKLPL